MDAPLLRTDVVVRLVRRSASPGGAGARSGDSEPGVAQLAHPEPGYFVVGMKSYGRAPTFLLLTGYEQVRSVVCALVGDEAALTVELELPETGLCSACTGYLEERARLEACACNSDDEPGEDCCAEPSIAQALEARRVAAD